MWLWVCVCMQPYTVCDSVCVCFILYFIPIFSVYVIKTMNDSLKILYSIVYDRQCSNTTANASFNIINYYLSKIGVALSHAKHMYVGLMCVRVFITEQNVVFVSCRRNSECCQSRSCFFYRKKNTVHTNITHCVLLYSESDVCDSINAINIVELVLSFCSRIEMYVCHLCCVAVFYCISQII